MAGRTIPRGPILRGVGKINGDGWKDTTRKGEIVFVYGSSLPPPYSAGQFPRVGNPIWSASLDQYEFSPASLWERLKLLPTIWRDRKSPYFKTWNRA
jgi:hypothetical protein